MSELASKPRAAEMFYRALGPLRIVVKHTENAQWIGRPSARGAWSASIERGPFVFARNVMQHMSREEAIRRVLGTVCWMAEHRWDKARVAIAAFRIIVGERSSYRQPLPVNPNSDFAIEQDRHVRPSGTWSANSLWRVMKKRGLVEGGESRAVLLLHSALTQLCHCKTLMLHVAEDPTRAFSKHRENWYTSQLDLHSPLAIALLDAEL